MSWLLTVLNIVVNVLLILLAASVSWGLFRLFAKISHPATGDPELAAVLKRHANRWSSHRVAVAHVNLHRWPNIRMAFMGCDELTPFEIGSATQALTGLLAAEAIARRELALDTRLGDLEPRLTGPLAEQTVKALLTHTSGLPEWARRQRIRTALLSFVFGLSPFTRRGPDIVAVASKQSLTPGYRDSQIGAALLGHLLAGQSGNGFHDLLQTRVLEPAGMVDTTTDPARHKVKRGWRAFGRKSFPWATDGYAPAVGAVSTLADLAALTHALLSKNAPGQRGLQALAGVETKSKRGLDSRQAMLWAIETVGSNDTGLSGKRQLAWRLGQTGGYSAFIGVIPSARRGIVVLSDTAVDSATQSLAFAIMHELEG